MTLWGIIEDFSLEASLCTSGIAAVGYLYTEPWGEEADLRIAFT